MHRAAHILGNEAGEDATKVQRRFDGLVAAISRHRAKAGSLAGAIEHFCKVTRSYRPGLFHCYAVPDLPRAGILVLAGSIMGGAITDAVREVQQRGVPVIALSMVGSVPDAADLVVSDPVQAGVMAVMAIADTATFDIARQKGRRY